MKTPPLAGHETDFCEALLAVRFNDNSSATDTSGFSTVSGGRRGSSGIDTMGSSCRRPAASTKSGLVSAMNSRRMAN